MANFTLKQLLLSLLLLLSLSNHALAANPQYVVTQALTCPQARNLSLLCLNEKIRILKLQAQNVTGSGVHSDLTLTSKVCALCRSYQLMVECLDVSFEYCTNEDVQTFLSTQHVNYIGTVGRFCNNSYSRQGMTDHISCFNGLAINSRRCFQAVNSLTCDEIRRRYDCSTTIAETFCATRFDREARLREISRAFLHMIEPSIDSNSCFPNSSNPLEQIFPFYHLDARQMSLKDEIKTTTQTTPHTRRIKVFGRSSALSYHNSDSSIFGAMSLIMLIISLVF